jgi:hypothetical protein
MPSRDGHLHMPARNAESSPRYIREVLRVPRVRKHPRLLDPHQRHYAVNSEILVKSIIGVQIQEDIPHGPELYLSLGYRKHITDCTH